MGPFGSHLGSLFGALGDPLRGPLGVVCACEIRRALAQGVSDHQPLVSTMINICFYKSDPETDKFQPKMQLRVTTAATVAAVVAQIVVSFMKLIWNIFRF